MKTKRLFQFFLVIMVMFAFGSCGDDDNDLTTGTQKGVHKIEITVSSQSNNIITVLSYAGIGKDGINANAPLYNESGEKCGDGSYVRTKENGVGKFICYTNSDATGLMCAAGVSFPEKGSSATMVCVAYIDNKEVSRIERTLTSDDHSIVSIQTFSQD